MQEILTNLWLIPSLFMLLVFVNISGVGGVPIKEWKPNERLGVAFFTVFWPFGVAFLIWAFFKIYFDKLGQKEKR